jgi:hypothetical protein
MIARASEAPTMPDDLPRKGPGPKGPDYDDDFYAWTQHQAAVLRAMPVTDNRFDREHVAEEIEDLGKSERDAVRSQVRRIIVHFLKLQYSPAQDPRYGWMASIVDARVDIEEKITRTIRNEVESDFSRLYSQAKKQAAVSLQQYGEQEVIDRLPTDCPYTFDQVLDEDWYPEPPENTP